MRLSQWTGPSCPQSSKSRIQYIRTIDLIGAVAMLGAILLPVNFRNGWHHTGDMGYFDADGYLRYAGRAPEKELIKTGGENVYPA